MADSFEDKLVKTNPNTLNRAYDFVPLRGRDNPIKKINYDAGFWESTGAAWGLQWTGQVSDMFTLEDNHLLQPVDTELNIAQHIGGYEQYAEEFAEARNIEHINFIKNKIDLNEDRRYLLEEYDGFMPDVMAALADPITYVPIPLAKGLSFATRFGKGFGYGAGLLATTEPIRLSQDPTSSITESIAYVGGGGLLIGLLTGFVGPRVAAKTIANKGGVQNIEQNYHTSMGQFEGKYDPSTSGIRILNNDLLEGLNIELKAGEVKTESLGQTTFTPNESRLSDKRYNPVKYDKKKDTYVVDEEYLRLQFEEGIDTGRINVRQWADADSYIQFRILREYIKQSVPGAKNLKTDELNGIASKQFIDRNIAYGKKEKNLFLRFIDEQSAFGRAFKNPYTGELHNKLVNTAIRLTGDGAKRVEGLVQDSSVIVKRDLNFALNYGPLYDNLTALFVAERLGAEVAAKKVGPLGTDYNTASVKLQIRDAVRNMVNKVPFTAKTQVKTKRDFYEEVGSIYARGKNSPEYQNASPNIQKAVDEVESFFGSYIPKLNKGRGLMTKENVDFYIMRIDEKLVEARAFKETGKKKTRLDVQEQDKFIAKLEGQKRYMTRIKEEFDAGIRTNFKLEKGYLPRVWKPEAIRDNREILVKIFADHFRTTDYFVGVRNKATGQLEKVNRRDLKTWKGEEAEAEKVVDELIERGNRQDNEHMLGIDYDNVKDGWHNFGVSPLMFRKYKISNEEVADFIELDAEFLTRSYGQKVEARLSMEETFGDSQLILHSNDIEFDIIKNGFRNNKDINKANEYINGIKGDRDKIYGYFNHQDPASWNKRIAMFLRDWASLAFMGKVVIAALVDAGRPVMSEGFTKAYGKNIGVFARDLKIYQDAMKQYSELVPMLDLALSSSGKRFIEDGGQFGIGQGAVSRVVDSVFQKFNAAQGPWYHMNLLSGWTNMMKNMHKINAGHRIIQDSVKVSKGTASKFEIQRLKDYGISEVDARVIANMPFEEYKVANYNPVLLPNADEWLTKPGGQRVRRKLQEAIYMDVQNTIITPSIADKPNLMYGVFTVNSEKMARWLETTPMAKQAAKWMGYEKLERGGQFNNAFAGLIFQFFSWSMAANRKLVASGISGREAHLMSGALAMLSLGMLSDYAKNPSYWTYKPTEEKIIRAIEVSGVLALYGDMNFITETVSGGIFGKSVGLRPALGLPNRFKPDMASGIGEITGAGPGILVDLGYVFTHGDYDARKDAVRRVIPFMGHFAIADTFKKIYNTGVDEVFE